MLKPSALDIAGWLAYCFIGYTAFLIGWTIWKRRAPEHAIKWMRWLAHVRKTRGMISFERAWVIALALTSTGLLMFAASRQAWPDSLQHNLRIERRVSDRQWWIVSDENPQGFMYYACDDFANAEWIVAGYFARTARWQVKGGCNSIRGDGYGFWYEWKSDGSAKTIQEATYE